MLLHQARLFIKRLGLLLLCAGVAVLIDQLSKAQVERTLLLGESADFLPPLLTWTYVQNTGAAFSMLQNGGPVFFVLAAVASAFIVVYTFKLPEKDQLSRFALGLILGGITGNIIDRIRQGYVTDFIHFQIPAINFDFAVFNGADSFLFIGVVILIILSLRREQKAAPAISLPS